MLLILAVVAFHRLVFASGLPSDDSQGTVDGSSWLRTRALFRDSVSIESVSKGLCQTQSSASLTLTLGPQVIKGMVGFSFQKNNLGMPQGLFSAGNLNFIQLLRTLGVTDLRLGGNPTDVSIWNTSSANRGVNNHVTPHDIDALAGFAEAADVSVIYGIRFLGNTIEEAVAEAKYVSQVLGKRLKAFEIGNEPIFYSQVSQNEFISQWIQIQEAIKAAVPLSKFSGPAFDPNTPQRAAYYTSFVNSASKSLDLLTTHYYHFQPSSDVGLTDILLQPDANSLYGLNVSLSLSERFNIPGGVRVDECNPFAALAESNVVFGAALWAIQYLLTLSTLGVSGANFHNNAMITSSDLHGPSLLFDRRSGEIIGMRPIFYGLFFFSKLGAGRLLQFQSSNLDANIGIIERIGGGISIAIVNPSQSKESVFDLNLPNNGYTTLYGYLLTAPSVNSLTNVTFAGSTIALNGSWVPQIVDVLHVCTTRFPHYVKVRVPPGSAYMIRNSKMVP